jgi:protein gp37
MGENTNIQWTHHTFNPWSGCAKVHRGCAHCYAEALVPSMRRRAAWGEVWQGGTRVVAAEGYWRLPLAWARTAARAGERHRVFCASTADVLEVPGCPERWPVGMLDEAPVHAARVHETRAALESARARLWEIIRVTTDTGAAAPDEPTDVYAGAIPPLTRTGLDWLLLTKRPENWHMVPEDVRPAVWLGTSVSDQETADEWVPRLLQAQGFRLRFLSVEPLTGPVDLSRWLPGKRYYLARCSECRYIASTETFIEQRGFDDADVVCPKCRHLSQEEVPGLDWVIVGGESGRNAAPCQVEWIRDVVRQCREAGVPCFVKQLGAVPAMIESTWRSLKSTPVLSAANQQRVPPGLVPLALGHPKGGDPAEWPEDLRVQHLPVVPHE